MSKKILILAASGRYLQTHRAGLIHEVVKQGYSLTLVGPDVGDFFSYPFEIVNFSRANLNPFKEIRTLWKLVRLYRKYKPDIVHHVGFKPALVGGVAAWLCRAPKVIHAVSGLGLAIERPFVTKLIRLIMRFFWKKSIVFVQNELDEAFVQGLCKEVVSFPGSGVNLQYFSPPETEPTKPPFVLTLASRLLWSKGIGWFVEAVKILKQKGLPVEGWLAGPLDNVNPDAINEGQLEEWKKDIHYWGALNDTADLYRQSHVVILPTRYREGVPKALIEAAACGRPIITMDRPGCNQVLIPGVNGFFVNTVDEIVESVEKLYSDDSLRLSMARQSRLHAENTFDEQNIIKRTLDIYNA